MAYRNPRYMFANAFRDALSVFASNEDEETPLVRLYDGLQDPPFRFGTNAADHYVAADLGVDPAPYSRLILAAGHNLGGATWIVEESATSDFASVVTLGGGVFDSGDGMKDEEFDEPSLQYVRVRFSDEGEWFLTELTLTETRETTRGPEPDWVDWPRPNVNLTVMRGGQAYRSGLGEDAQEILYTYRDLGADDRTVFEELLATTESGIHAFYLDRTRTDELPMLVYLTAPTDAAQDLRNPRGLGREALRLRLSMAQQLG